MCMFFLNMGHMVTWRAQLGSTWHAKIGDGRPSPPAGARPPWPVVVFLGLDGDVAVGLRNYLEHLSVFNDFRESITRTQFGWPGPCQVLLNDVRFTPQFAFDESGMFRTVGMPTGGYPFAMHWQEYERQGVCALLGASVALSAEFVLEAYPDALVVTSALDPDAFAERLLDQLDRERELHGGRLPLRVQYLFPTVVRAGAVGRQAALTAARELYLEHGAFVARLVASRPAGFVPGGLVSITAWPSEPRLPTAAEMPALNDLANGLVLFARRGLGAQFVKTDKDMAMAMLGFGLPDECGDRLMWELTPASKYSPKRLGCGSRIDAYARSTSWDYYCDARHRPPSPPGSAASEQDAWPWVSRPPRARRAFVSALHMATPADADQLLSVLSALGDSAIEAGGSAREGGASAVPKHELIEFYLVQLSSLASAGRAADFDVVLLVSAASRALAGRLARALDSFLYKVVAPALAGGDDPSMRLHVRVLAHEPVALGLSVWRRYLPEELYNPPRFASALTAWRAKLRVLELTEYERVVLTDCDVLLPSGAAGSKAIDALFVVPPLEALHATRSNISAPAHTPGAPLWRRAAAELARALVGSAPPILADSYTFTPLNGGRVVLSPDCQTYVDLVDLAHGESYDEKYGWAHGGLVPQWRSQADALANLPASKFAGTGEAALFTRATSWHAIKEARTWNNVYNYIGEQGLLFFQYYGVQGTYVPARWQAPAVQLDALLTHMVRPEKPWLDEFVLPSTASRATPAQCAWHCQVRKLSEHRGGLLGLLASMTARRRARDEATQAAFEELVRRSCECNDGDRLLGAK